MKILLLPAFPTFSRTWLPMAKQLAQSGFQVLTLDLLGTGFSDSPQLEGGAAATVEAYVDQAMELVDALGFMKPFTVVYVSSGEHGGDVDLASFLLTRIHSVHRDILLLRHSSSIQWLFYRCACGHDDCRGEPGACFAADLAFARWRSSLARRVGRTAKRPVRSCA